MFGRSVGGGTTTAATATATATTATDGSGYARALSKTAAACVWSSARRRPLSPRWAGEEWRARAPFALSCVGVCAALARAAPAPSLSFWGIRGRSPTLGVDGREECVEFVHARVRRCVRETRRGRKLSERGRPATLAATTVDDDGAAIPASMARPWRTRNQGGQRGHAHRSGRSATQNHSPSTLSRPTFRLFTLLPPRADKTTPTFRARRARSRARSGRSRARIRHRSGVRVPPAPLLKKSPGAEFLPPSPLPPPPSEPKHHHVWTRQGR